MMAMVCALMLTSCGDRQRQGLYYGNYGYGYGEKGAQDSLTDDAMDEEQQLPIKGRNARVDESNSPVPSSYSSDKAEPGEYGDNHGLIDDEAYFEGSGSGYDE